MEKEDIFDELEELVGTEAADILTDHYAGSAPYFSQRAKTRKKYRKIREAFKNGTGYKELARQYGYTAGHVRRIIHDRRFRDSSHKNT